MNTALKELCIIFGQYGVKLCDNDKQRPIEDIIDDIYLKLSRQDLLDIMDEIELNSLEIFGEKHGN